MSKGLGLIPCDITEKKGIICVTTNGCIKSNGAAVMGRGIAYYWAQRILSCAYKLAEHTALHGNVPGIIAKEDGITLVSPPLSTKDNWRYKSSIDLIAKSCEHLVKLVDEKWMG